MASKEPPRPVCVRDARPAFTALMLRLYVVFGRPDTAEEVELKTEAYWEALSDCTLAEVDAAVREAVRTFRGYCPHPADLREMIAQARRREREAAGGRRALPPAPDHEANARSVRQLLDEVRGKLDRILPGTVAESAHRAAPVAEAEAKAEVREKARAAVTNLRAWAQERGIALDS